MTDTHALLRALPKIDELMGMWAKETDVPTLAPPLMKEFCRQAVEEVRKAILRAVPMTSAEVTLRVMEHLRAAIGAITNDRLRRVINATGVVLHTNLGRAPLSPRAARKIMDIASGYSNLEFDLEGGERGQRYDHVRDLLRMTMGSEDALVVNNNAAAVLLVLTALAQGKEVIVSRGELVEIGGEFRIPEIMAQSGACLREVGTTNRTRLSDYAAAMGPETALILKVHPSNFRIMGFTSEVALRELVALGMHASLPVMFDLGSGNLIPLERYGLAGEPTVFEVMATGVDIVTISGDKLLGGPQAGIILGRRELVARISKHPLTRALRIDKLTLAALEVTLRAYLDPHGALRELPVLNALTTPIAEIRRCAQALSRQIRKNNQGQIQVHLRPVMSLVGGVRFQVSSYPA